MFNVFLFFADGGILTVFQFSKSNLALQGTAFGLAFYIHTTNHHVGEASVPTVRRYADSIFFLDGPEFLL